MLFWRKSAFRLDMLSEYPKIQRMSNGTPKFRARSINELLDRSGLDKRQFAERIGVSRQLLGAWLSDTVEPKFSSLLRLCGEFDVDPSYFAEGLPDHSTEAA